MKLTNKYGLPEVMYRALSGGITSEVGELDLSWKRGNIAVTTLVQPVRLAVLQARHSEEIEEDVSERLWLLMGTGVHAAIERVRVDNTMKEVSLSLQRVVPQKEGPAWEWTVRGRFDIAIHGKPGALAQLIDWKVGSVWGYKFMRPGEHEPQTNLYNLLAYRVWGLNFTDLCVWLIMRDWMEREAQADPKYPRIPFAEIPVAMWPMDEAENWLQNRLEEFDTACQVKDNDLPFCTAEETWERPGVWVVSKAGVKKACRLMPTKEKAEEWMMGNTGDKVSYRPGERTRCERYCRAMPFCSQYKAWKEEAANGDANGVRSVQA